ncbi:hypothetical protein RO21_10870 [[Actinobacillus] muris]|uniref:Phage tail assembly protein n=1 Tax=Muribacter muris TaxID=67855 RepID=A0A0J5P561_9PAST|nr:phage tail assembly protein [Muribacter muris]KMK50614.1 hypothetical protein RO21_10870 [[Actinobacillus] muris] [Muribacter muris]
MSNQAVETLKNLRVYTTYQLKHPVDLADGTRLTEINLRRLKGKDLGDFEEKRLDSKHEYQMVKFFVNRLSNLTFEDIDELDGIDINGLTVLIVDLLLEGKPKASES